MVKITDMKLLIIIMIMITIFSVKNEQNFRVNGIKLKNINHHGKVGEESKTQNVYVYPSGKMYKVDDNNQGDRHHHHHHHHHHHYYTSTTTSYGNLWNKSWNWRRK